MTRGTLIVVEGLDGAGKTTQARLLAEALGAHYTREPSDGPIGARLRAILSDPASTVPDAALRLLFAADRLDHCTREITPALSAGQHVVCDRYDLSNVVYQVAAEDQHYTGHSTRGLVDLLYALDDGKLVPDATVILAVSVETALARIAARGEAATRYERAATLARCAELYTTLAFRPPFAGRRTRIVSSEGRPAETHREVVGWVREVMAEMDAGVDSHA